MRYDPQEHAEFDVEFLKTEHVSGITDAEYRAAKALNQSFLKDVNDYSPYDAEYRQENKEEPTPAMKIGSLMHCLALTPEDAGLYVIKPDYDARTNEGKRVRDEFMAASVGKVVLKDDEYRLAKSMADACAKHLPFFPDNNPNIKFVTEAVVYSDAIVTGGPFKGQMVRFKGKLDGMCLFDVRAKDGSVRIYDLKSCADISDIAGASYKGGWATQAALYSDMAQHCFQRDTVFEYVCVSKAEPFSVRRAMVSHEMLLKGRKAYKTATSKWLWYLNNGKPKSDEFYGLEVLNA